MRTGLVVLGAVIAALIIWALVGGDDDEGSTTQAASGVGPVGLSAQDLRSTAQSLGQPVYWAGQKSGFTYEYTQTTDGTTFVRYLPPGVEVGDDRTNFLIVATYRFSGALPALQEVSAGREIDLPGGGIALVDQGYPKSVHVAFPDVDYQIEVFHPSPERAKAEATSGDIAPVG